ncbi:MAG: ATP-binding cassette domain-containing protein, partial [Oscillospiraceae bacterium]|nr:ATP-binding cassette domain-containing protein [Oscillospiraceae bacterium]
MVYAAVALFGAIAVIDRGAAGGITVGELSCFLSYANQYTKPFNEISGVVTELQNAFACAARLFELIEEPSEAPDAEDAVTLTDAKGSIKAENVYFSYVPDKKLIENFNIDIKPGQKTAIVGPTGCGKTTFINLLMRFYDVTDGAIYADGHDIRKVTRKSLRSSYGMVLQETRLISGTIRDNIVMGKPEATDDEVKAAAKASHAHSFIKRLPHGYDTVISGMGSQSSDLYRIANDFVKRLTCLRIKEADSKMNLEDVAEEAGADYVVDEKARTATLTRSGIVKAEQFFNVGNLSDPDNLTLSHHINIAIKAHGIMRRDIDYVVKDGEVLIVDEFTGRIMIGRRYNEGLHQAIEAKEGVKIARENKTLATITFQNYFRLYEKLSGMTGTAMTEVAEFREIY